MSTTDEKKLNTDNVKPNITLETNEEVVTSPGSSVGGFNLSPTELPRSFDDVNLIFNVSNEKREEIRNKIFNDIQEGKIELPPGEDAFTYARQLSGKEVNELQKKLNDDKVKYISNISGLNILNESLPAGENMALHFLLGRDREFGNRKKRFLKAFPGGEFTKVAIPMGGDTVEEFEIFKLPGDKDYRMFDSIGNDAFANEALQFAGSILNFQTAGDVVGSLAAYAGPVFPQARIPIIGLQQGFGLAKFIMNQPLFRVGFGNLFGKNVDQAVDSYFGYDKGAFAEDGSAPFLTNFYNFNNLQEAALSAGVFKAFDFIPAYLSGNTKLVTKDQFTKEIAKISQRYNLEPAMTGQLIASPFFRRTFFQSAEFDKLPKEKFAAQIKSATELLKRMENGEQFSLEMLLQTHKTLEQNFADAVQSVVRSNMSPKDAADALNESFVKWNDMAVAKNEELRKTIASLAAKDGSLNGQHISISGIQNGFKDVKRSIQSINKGEPVEVVVDGKTKKIKPNVVIGGKSKDATALLDIINDFNKLPGVLNFTSSQKASQHINTLMKLQNELFNLRFSPDTYVAAEAKKMHKRVKNLFKNTTGDNDDFAFNMQAIYSQLDADENVRGINFVVDAITNKNANVRTIVNDFLSPGNFQVHALKEVLNTTGPGANAAFDVVRDLWLKKLLSDPGNAAKNLAKWQSDDPTGLALLMEGVDYKQIDDIVKLGLKTQNSVFKDAIEKDGTVSELINNVLKTVKSKDFVGKNAAIRDIIEQAGAIKNGVIDYNHPFMVSARSGILQDIFEKSMKFQRDLDSIRMDEIADNRAKDKIFTSRILKEEVDEAGDLIPIQPEFDITKLNKLVAELKDDEYLKQFFSASDLEAIKNIDRYFTIINSANPKVGSILQQAELSADLVKNMFDAPQLFNIGTTLVKYDLLARALSKPVTQEILANVTNEQLRSNPAMVIKALLTSLTREISDDFGTYEEGVLESVGGYDLMSDIEDDAPKPALSVTLPTLDSMGKGTELPTVNSQIPIVNNSTLSQANVINPNIAAAGQSVFGPTDPVFSGIMTTNVGRQRVA
jgi:rRNA processing protein Krr1/Pno1